MFAFDTHFDAPLVTSHADLPLFDDVLLYTFSDASALDLASMPVPPSRASSRNKDPDHIPRPRNAFMLFRSAFAAAQKVSAKIEHDNRHITRIIAHCWNRLSDADKQIWRDKAAAEKAQHKERYPNYRFRPVGRTKKPRKRQVRRNGDKDVRRTLAVADLVMAGSSGSEMERAMTEIDKYADALAADEKLFVLDPHVDDNVPPFLSPLLPPQQSADMPQPLHLGPQTPDVSLFQPHQYYQPTDPSPSHHQSVITFVQGGPAELEQSAPEYSMFTWNQSNSYTYYH